MTGQISLADMLADAPTTKWIIAKVDSVQTSERAVTLSYHGGLIPHVAYLKGQAPSAGDVVHCLTDDRNGLIVIGEEQLRTAVPVDPSPPQFTVAPTGSSTFFQEPPPPHWSGTQVQQGPGRAGAFFYPASAFTSLVGVPLSRVEVQLTISEDSEPLGFVLHHNTDTSAPFEPVSSVYMHHVMDWMTDWHAMPLGWGDALGNGTASGFGLMSDIYSATVISGGTLRFTPL